MTVCCSAHSSLTDSALKRVQLYLSHDARLCSPFSLSIVCLQDLNAELEKLTKEYEEKISNLSEGLTSEWELKLKNQSEELEVSVYSVSFIIIIKIIYFLYYIYIYFLLIKAFHNFEHVFLPNLFFTFYFVLLVFELCFLSKYRK